MTGVTWVGAKQGGVFAGTLPTSGATFLYQVEGQRLMACLPIMECFQLMQKYNDVSDPLTTVAADHAPTVIKECLQVKSQTQTQTYRFFCSSLLLMSRTLGTRQRCTFLTLRICYGDDTLSWCYLL